MDGNLLSEQGEVIQCKHAALHEESHRLAKQKVETPQGLLTTTDAFRRNITRDHMLETLCGPIQSEQEDFSSDLVRKLSAAFLSVAEGTEALP